MKKAIRAVWLSAICCAAAGECQAAGVAVSDMPAWTFADTETSTNCALRIARNPVEDLSLVLEFAGGESNNVEVAFGFDANTNGVLDVSERGLSVGWDCGEWVLRDHRGGCAAAVGRSAGRRRLEWTLWLRPDKTARRLFAEDDGVVFDGAVPSTFYSPEWSIARVVRRGPEPSACVSYDMSVFPLTIKLR